MLFSFTHEAQIVKGISLHMIYHLNALTAARDGSIKEKR